MTPTGHERSSTTAPTMLTPGEVTQILEIPPSSLRRYVQLFGAHLSSHATKKRARRYSDADVATLQRIRELTTQDGIKLENVADHLDQVIDHERPAPTALTLPGLIKDLKTLQQAAQDLRSELAETREIQKAQAAELDQLRSWMQLPAWRRLFTKTPAL